MRRTAPQPGPRSRRRQAAAAGSVLALGVGLLAVPAFAATGHEPIGAVQDVRPGVGGIQVAGWALDPDAPGTVTVTITLDHRAAAPIQADTVNAASTSAYPNTGSHHGFDTTIAATAGAHQVCLSAADVNSAGTATGSSTSLGCYSVRVKLAAVPTATATAPATPRTTTSAPKAKVTPAAAAIAGVTVPALISTSRYIRNIHGTSADAARTRTMGIADGRNNPANHKYLTLLQIGGQTTKGVVLSATSTYVTYAEVVSAMKAYITGYASTQQSNAPAIIAIGTNNDMDVRNVTGALWATKVVNPLRGFAHKYYRHITIAGANDIEPGFLGTVAQSQAWLTGYLGATTAKFVFNGSADGCGWTRTHTRCNNDWWATNIQWLSGGAAPTRILSLPQIYNQTMPKQWKYISLTGITHARKKLSFAGPLTEWTACYKQRGGCGSLTNNTAWSALWAQLKSDPRTSQKSLPYGTDLRIN